MKIVVDALLCAGHGVCEEVAPELFRLESDGIAHVLLEDVGDAHLKSAQTAMLRCPAEAISLRR